MSSILAIIVTYNRRELLLQGLASLRASANRSFDVLVYDNASTDGTYEAIRDAIDLELDSKELAGHKKASVPKVPEGFLPEGRGRFSDGGRLLYFRSPGDLGCTGGINAGMIFGLEAGYDHFWLMDDDTSVTESCLDRLLECAEKTGSRYGTYGFICSFVNWKDGTYCKMNAPVFHVTWPEKQELFADGIFAAFCGTFVSMLVSREAVIKCGLPVKEFFLWNDDIEFSTRLSREYPCYMALNSIAIHNMAVNKMGDIIDDDGSRLDRHQRSYRNNVFMQREWGRIALIKHLISVVWLCCKIPFKSKNHKFAKVWAVFSGTIKGFFFHPEIEMPARFLQLKEGSHGE